MADTTRDLFALMTYGMNDIDVLITLFQSFIAADITVQRIKKGMTQADLAKKLNVTPTVVSRWESGARDLRLSTIVRIADALDVEIRSPFVTDRNVGDKNDRDTDVLNKKEV